jgi:hypothetical protein
MSLSPLAPAGHQQKRAELLACIEQLVNDLLG